MAKARSDHLFKAKICEQTERFDDMLKEMNELVNLSSRTEPLTVEERNLLSVAYKNVVGSKRSSWRVVSNKLEHEQNELLRECCRKMKQDIVKELTEVCNEMLGLLDNILIPNTGDDYEAELFFIKIKGDYYRYMAEICDESRSGSREELTQKSKDTYKEAMEIARTKIGKTNHIWLGLALSHSVFMYEINKDLTAAYEFAKPVFDDAIPLLDSLTEESYKDATVILQLMRDNLTQWRAELDAGKT